MAAESDREGASRITVFPGAEEGREIDLLRRAEAILRDPSFTGAFPGVRFDVPRTFVLPAGEMERAIPAVLAAMAAPLRVTGGGREIFLPNACADEGTRRERLAAALGSLGEGAGTVVVREAPGTARSGRHYPSFSGVLFPENFYPVSYMKPAEGIAYVSLGLGAGNRVSMRAVRFSPSHPDLMPDFSTPQDILRHSQRTFLAVDLSGDAETPAEFDLATAMKDGALAPVGGVFSRENQTVYPGVHRDGIRVVTFAFVLRGGVFPLPKILAALRDRLRTAAGESLAAEYAVDLAGPAGGGDHSFFLERVLPRPRSGGDGAIDLTDLEGLGAHAICSSNATLGDGSFAGIRDILCLCPDRLDIASSPEIAREVGAFNEALKNEGRPYALIGSGRWGTTDKWLGIPVSWGQVSGAKIQVEVGLEEFNVESSRGTHFFRELTFHEVGAMHVGLEKPGDRIDWEWLAAHRPVAEGRFVRRLAFADDLPIRIDGMSGRGFILKP